MKKKKGGGGGGANWMDTYGDMVTLLLCFFVLLYSMSTVSEDKWRAIVQSFNPGAVIDPTEIIGGNDGPLADPFDGIAAIAEPYVAPEDLAAAQEEIDDALQQLYDALQQFVNDNGLGQSVEVTKGDGYIFISFNDMVFFAGDSYALLDAAYPILDAVAGALNNAADYIDEIRVMGHTAQAYSDSPNNVWNDRMLASQRSAVVAIHLQEQTDGRISAARIVNMGYGQWRPVSPNTDEAHRSKNRRVEIMITGIDLLNQMGGSVQQYYSLRTGGEETAPVAETQTSEQSEGTP